MKTILLEIEGMHCRSCEMIVQDELGDIGVESKASHESGEIEVTFDETKNSIDEIKKIIEKEGYKVLP